MYLLKHTGWGILIDLHSVTLNIFINLQIIEVLNFAFSGALCNELYGTRQYFFWHTSTTLNRMCLTVVVWPCFFSSLYAISTETVCLTMDIILQSISNLYTDTPLYTGLCSCVLVAGFLVRESWRGSCGKWISLLCHVSFHSSYSWKLARDKYHREWQWWVSELFKNMASLCCD